MPRTALTTDEIEAFRDELREVAERLFAESGYEGVTLRGIAGALGLSAMAPYRYFRNKAEIFAAVRASAFGRFADVQEAAFESSEDPLDRLGALALAYVRFATGEPHAYRIMFELHPAEDVDTVDVDREGERAWLPLLRAVTLAIEAGVLDGDPETVAHVFWAGIHGLVTLDLSEKLRTDHSLEDLLPPMLRALVRGNRNEEDSPWPSPTSRNRPKPSTRKRSATGSSSGGVRAASKSATRSRKSMARSRAS